MKYDNKSFQERYQAWKNGADYWKDIRGINLGGNVQDDEPSNEDQEQINMKVQSILNSYDAGKDSEERTFTYDIASDIKDPLPQFKGGKGNYIDDFVGRLAPLVGQQLNRYGYKNDAAFYNIMRQLAWESNYGRSRVARQQHNYGGVGWNGKTYTTYKNDADFINAYVRLMHNRYGAALRAKSTQDYAKALKQKGYYEDTLQHYTNGLMGMRSVVKAAYAHRKNNKDSYNYNVKLNDVIQDYDDTRNASPIIINSPSTKQPETINAAVPITLLGPSEEEIKAKQYQDLKNKAFDLIATPTPLPNAIQNMLQGNNFGKDAYGQKFWQRRGLNLHFDDGKDPYLYLPADYDFVQARDLGYQPGEDGHWPSRNYKTGRYLKSPVHPTLYKGIIADNSLGYYPYYKDGAIYTNTWRGNEPYTDMLENYIQYRSKKKKGNKK